MVAWKTGMNIDEMRIVLMVSEDVQTAEIWATLFRQKNCDVLHETSPHAAVQSARLLAPSLILLDLDLPHSELLALCAKLRTTTHGALLLLAPYGNGTEIFDYYNAGVDEHLATPISPMALIIKSMTWMARQVWYVPNDHSASSHV